jgi:hypothetical protein
MFSYTVNASTPSSFSNSELSYSQSKITQWDNREITDKLIYTQPIENRALKQASVITLSDLFFCL